MLEEKDFWVRLNPIYENASLAQAPSRSCEKMEIYEELPESHPEENTNNIIVERLCGKKFSLIDDKLINKNIMNNIESLDPLIKRILERQHEK